MAFKGSLTAGAGGGGALTGGGSTHRQAPGGQEGGPGTHSRALQCCPGPGLWEEERALGLSQPKARHIPSEDARREGQKVQMVGFSVRTGALGGSLPGCRALEVTRAHGWATTPTTSPSGGPMSMRGDPGWSLQGPFLCSLFIHAHRVSTRAGRWSPARDAGGQAGSPRPGVSTEGADGKAAGLLQLAQSNRSSGGKFRACRGSGAKSGGRVAPKMGCSGPLHGRGPAPWRSGRQGPGTGSVGAECHQTQACHDPAQSWHGRGVPSPRPRRGGPALLWMGADPGSTASLTGVLAPFLRSPGTTWTHPCHMSRKHPVGQPCPEYSRESFPVLRLSGGSGRLGTGMCGPPGAVGTLGNTACSPSCHSRSLGAPPHPSRALLSPGKQRREVQAHMGRGLRGPWGL